MNRNFDIFLEEDHKEHLERSLQAILEHADLTNEKTEDERKEFFRGLMGMFPVMMLGHYYEWLTEREPKDYFDSFIPKWQSVTETYIERLTNRLFDEKTEPMLRAVLLASYMQTYPYELLRAFVLWAKPDAAGKAEEFLAKERTEGITSLSRQITEEITAGTHLSLAASLAGDYPFELLGRFHHAVME